MSERAVWQIAGGMSGRYFEELFLRHDVMCLGPGDPGEYFHNPQAYEGEPVKSFCEEVQPNDIVLLRKGYEVVAIGRVADMEAGYQHDECFDDVHGWDLQHTRRVVWQRGLETQLKEIQRKQPVFSNMKQMGRFNRVGKERFLDPVRRLFELCRLREPVMRPDYVSNRLDDEALGEALFSEGLANESVERVIEAIQRQRRLRRWYRAHGEKSDRPTEHEVVAHMVLPLLLALGWSEQLLGVEWKKVDLAAFVGVPTRAETCVLVCEAKGGSHGLQEVVEQAAGYVRTLGLTSARKVMVTNGSRFLVYERNGESWSKEPTGYLNVKAIRRRHLVFPRTDAVATLVGLTPANVDKPIRPA